MEETKTPKELYEEALYNSSIGAIAWMFIMTIKEYNPDIDWDEAYIKASTKLKAANLMFSKSEK